MSGDNEYCQLCGTEWPACGSDRPSVIAVQSDLCKQIEARNAKSERDGLAAILEELGYEVTFAYGAVAVSPVKGSGHAV